MSVGDVWSYQGKKVTIVEPHGEVGRLVTVAARTKEGRTERVTVSELRALAAAMPMRMIPTVVKVGAFIIYRDKEEGITTEGTIMAVSEASDELVVHMSKERLKDKARVG